MDNIENIISLEYRGKLVEKGQMDSYAVSESIKAFSDFISVLSKSTYGEISVNTNISGFRPNSFDIDFAISMSGHVTNLIAVAPFTIEGLNELIRSCFDVYLHLKGKPPKSIEQVSNNTYNIENMNGDIKNYTAETINLVNNIYIGESLEACIKKPLERGVDEIGLRSANNKSKDIVKVTKDDAEAFTPIIKEDDENSNIDNNAVLTITAPDFRENNKWKFNYRGSNIYANINCKKFLSRVNKGIERFGKGDVLKAKMKVTNILKRNKPTQEYIITEVLEHISKPTQDDLFE